MTPTGPLGRLPPWVVDAGVGLGVVAVAAGALDYGWGAVVASLAPAFDIGHRSGFGVESVPAFVGTIALLVALYVGGSLALTYGVGSMLDLDPGLVAGRPDRATRRWAAAVVGLAPVVVGASTVAGAMTAPAGAVQVPVLVVGDPAAPLPAYAGPPNAAAQVLGIAVVTGSLGVAVGALLHGVLQQSMGRSAPLGPTVGVTALALVGLFGHTGDPVAVAALIAFGAAVGVAYDRTGNLAVPIVAYATFNAVALAATRWVLHLAATGTL